MQNKIVDLHILRKYNLALKLCEKAITKYHENSFRENEFGLNTYVSLLNDKGNTLAYLNKFRESIRCYDEALKINSTISVPLVNDSEIIYNKKIVFEKLKNS